MKRTFPIRTLVTITISLAVASNIAAGDQPSVDPHLEFLQPWLDKTFKSEDKKASSGKPTTDVARWERALNGKAVRINAPHPETKEPSLPQAVIARWPHDGLNIDLGFLGQSFDCAD